MVEITLINVSLQHNGKGKWLATKQNLLLDMVLGYQHSVAFFR
jgi:hypothetical protein